MKVKVTIKESSFKGGVYPLNREVEYNAYILTEHDNNHVIVQRNGSCMEYPKSMYDVQEIKD